MYYFTFTSQIIISQFVSFMQQSTFMIKLKMVLLFQYKVLLQCWSYSVLQRKSTTSLGCENTLTPTIFTEIYFLSLFLLTEQQIPFSHFVLQRCCQLNSSLQLQDEKDLEQCGSQCVYVLGRLQFTNLLR